MMHPLTVSVDITVADAWGFGAEEAFLVEILLPGGDWVAAQCIGLQRMESRLGVQMLTGTRWGVNTGDPITLRPAQQTERVTGEATKASNPAAE